MGILSISRLSKSTQTHCNVFSPIDHTGPHRFFILVVFKAVSWVTSSHNYVLLAFGYSYDITIQTHTHLSTYQVLSLLNKFKM